MLLREIYRAKVAFEILVNSYTIYMFHNEEFPCKLLTPAHMYDISKCFDITGIAYTIALRMLGLC